MQNKPNLLNAQMNVSSVLTKDYNNKQRTMNNERSCKTNPIKPNFKGKKNERLANKKPKSKLRPKALHNFAFYILIFNFPSAFSAVNKNPEICEICGCFFFVSSCLCGKIFPIFFIFPLDFLTLIFGPISRSGQFLLKKRTFLPIFSIFLQFFCNFYQFLPFFVERPKWL